MNEQNHGHFMWHEHLTKDTAAAIAFYGEVAGWKTEPFGEGYTMWVASQGPLGGVITLPEAAAAMGAPPNWMGHVQVPDVDATAALAVERGGKLYHGPIDIPTVGRFAVLADPQGAVFSAYAPASDMARHDTTKEGEFCWNELLTSDPAAGYAFYAELFGWKTQSEMDMGPMGSYRLFGPGESSIGGMMKIPPGVAMPAAWLFYIGTADLDAAMARATAHGATLMNGPMPVPGGRIAQFTDPQGAVFALHQAVPQS